MRPQWQCKLRQQFQRLTTLDSAARVVVIGVGQELLGDDALGVLAARKLHSTAQVMVIDAGTAPENFTGRIRDFQPDLVVLIDAVQLGRSPGSIEWLESEAIVGCSASTHALPLQLFTHYLELESGSRVVVIGIQPGAMNLGDQLTPEVRASVHLLVRELDHGFRMLIGTDQMSDPAQE